MLDAVRSWMAGADVTRDSLRDTKRESRGTAKGKAVTFRKTYAFDFVPEDRRYKVSLVFLGKGQKKDDVLAAIRDIARRIEAGEIDLEKGGRFLKPKGNPRKPVPGDSSKG